MEAAGREPVQMRKHYSLEQGVPMRHWKMVWHGAESLAALLLVASAASSAETRVWTDSSGEFTVDAELVDADEHSAVLKNEKGRLITVPISKLSDADQKHVKKALTARAKEKAPQGDSRTWKLKDGSSITGRIVDYDHDPVLVQLRDGRVRVGDLAFSLLSRQEQSVVLRSMSAQVKQEFKSEQDISAWLSSQKGQRVVLQAGGVELLEPDGNDISVPFSLFDEKEQQYLRPGWDDWFKAQQAKRGQKPTDADLALQRDASFHLRARSRLEEKERQLNMAANQLVIQEAFGISNWRVELISANGNLPSREVIVPGRTSEDARFEAGRRYPGFQIGGIARIRSRWRR